MNVVIQGAGRGIGLAMAHKAIESDANHLFLTARHPAATQGYVDLPPGPNITWLALDNLKPDSIEKAGEQIRSQTDKLNRVICCSGVLKDEVIKPEKRLADIDAECSDLRLSGQCNRPNFTSKALLQALRGDHALCFYKHLRTCWIDQRQPVGRLVCISCQQSSAEPTDAHLCPSRWRVTIPMPVSLPCIPAPLIQHCQNHFNRMYPR